MRPSEARSINPKPAAFLHQNRLSEVFGAQLGPCSTPWDPTHLARMWRPIIRASFGPCLDSKWDPNNGQNEPLGAFRKPSGHNLDPAAPLGTQHISLVCGGQLYERASGPAWTPNGTLTTAKMSPWEHSGSLRGTTWALQHPFEPNTSRSYVAANYTSELRGLPGLQMGP